MKREYLLKKLNWFYSLEINQVDLYEAQSKSVSDIFLQKTLERVALIEQQHVDNIANKIRDLGASPTVIGDVIAPITGKIAGKITGWAGVLHLLQADIVLEEKAMKDYKDFILRVDDEDLFNLLWSNLIDENLHTAWFTNQVEQLQALKL